MKYRGIFFWQWYYFRWHNSVRWLTVEAFLAGAFVTVGIAKIWSLFL